MELIKAKQLSKKETKAKRFLFVSLSDSGAKKKEKKKKE